MISHAVPREGSLIILGQQEGHSWWNLLTSSDILIFFWLAVFGWRWWRYSTGIWLDVARCCLDHSGRWRWGTSTCAGTSRWEQTERTIPDWNYFCVHHEAELRSITHHHDGRIKYNNVEHGKTGTWYDSVLSYSCDYFQYLRFADLMRTSRVKM